MRFMGIIGIVFLLSVAFLFSTNKKAVKTRILLWGLGLQLLFATIILSQSFLSWLGMFVFFTMIVAYLFKDMLFKDKKIAFLPVIFIFAGAVVIIFAGYLLDSLNAASFCCILLLIIPFVLKFFKKQSLIKYSVFLFFYIFIGMVIHRQIYGQHLFSVLADYVYRFLKLADLGSVFLFGNLAKPEYFGEFGYQFAFSVLPTIIFFSALISILYYLGIMQAIVKAIAKFMQWTLGTSGAETLNCSANIFVGQAEAPLVIQPFLKDMTISEINAVMTSGFATIAGSVLGGYIRMGVDAGHLIAASVMSAPAALVMAKLLLPETQQSKTTGNVSFPEIKKASNILDALSSGIVDGLKLAVYVGAMLIAFVSLIGLIDLFFGFFDKLVDARLLGGSLIEGKNEYAGIFPGSLKTLFGTIFSPIAYIMGVPWADAPDVGNLLGIKIAVNEFVGYAELGKHIKAMDLSPKSLVIATYALCGFANFASVGIQIGGISALVPSRRPDIAKVALRAMLGGALASWLTASIAGILL